MKPPESHLSGGILFHGKREQARCGALLGAALRGKSPRRFRRESVFLCALIETFPRAGNKHDLPQCREDARRRAGAAPRRSLPLAQEKLGVQRPPARLAAAQRFAESVLTRTARAYEISQPRRSLRLETNAFAQRDIRAPIPVSCARYPYDRLPGTVYSAAALPFPSCNPCKTMP